MTVKDLPQTRQELVALAKDAAAGIRPALELLKDMAKRAGYEGRRGGWIYMSDQAIVRGWQGFAARVAEGSMTADLLAAWLPAGPAVAEVELEDPARYVVSPARTSEPEVTAEAALAEIGGCGAGGALTGKALEAHTAGDYAAAMVVAQAQKALQGEDLVAEDLEVLAPEEVRTPATHRVVPGDVARIHRGTRLYEVLEVVEDRMRDNLTGDVADMTMAHVAPCDPEDQRVPQWVHVDLLHVVPPVARVRTREVALDVAITEDVVVVTGAGWDLDRGDFRRVALIVVDGTRTLAIFRRDVPAGARPVAVLRIGDALVVDDRCYRVVWHGEDHVEPHLEPARWRDRLPA